MTWEIKGMVFCSNIIRKGSIPNKYYSLHNKYFLLVERISAVAVFLLTQCLFQSKPSKLHCQMFCTTFMQGFCFHFEKIDLSSYQEGTNIIIP